MISLNVLVVDDNVALAENIAEILGMEGHVTYVAASAEEALAKLRPTETDVVITDYRLPGISGADLIRRLASMGLGVRAIVISGHTDDETIRDTQETGAMFVPKPVDFGVLGDLVYGRR